MANNLKAYKKKLNDYLDVNKKRRIIFEYITTFFGTVLSALLMAVAFKTFLSPNVANATVIVSSGASGFARTISLIAEMITHNNENVYLTYSIAYAVINIPVIYVAFRFLSVRFGIFTLINVAIVSLLTNFVNLDFINLIAKHIACIIETDGGVVFQAGLLTRTFIAAILGALSSCVAFACGTSNGGADTISYCLALRKSTSVGPYMFIINGVIIVVYTILSLFKGGYNQTNIADACLVFIFAILYQLILSVVVDAINRLNKKEQLQIITKKENLTTHLLANIARGATVVRSKGAFTGQDRFIIYTTVSVHETKKVISIARHYDPECFINITRVKQVYGRFLLPKLK